MTNKREPIAYCPDCVRYKKDQARLVPWGGNEGGYICCNCFCNYDMDAARSASKLTGNRYIFGERRRRFAKSIMIMSDGKKIEGMNEAQHYIRSHPGTKIVREKHPI